LLLVALLPLSAHPAEAAPLPIGVYFSLRGGCTDAIEQALGDAREGVLVQTYEFTSAPIAKALLEAHTRGVSVAVILDKTNRNARYSVADFLAHAGIPVFIEALDGIAHNKILIIDNGTVITGSFNFTKAAEEKNAENLLVIHDSGLAKKYLENYNRQRTQSESYQGREQ